MIGTFPAGLLDEPSVAFLAALVDGGVVAGAVLNAAVQVVGLSNLFTVPGTATESLPAVVALAGDLFPGHPIVGYETGAALAAAVGSGFRAVGPLRVWVKEGP